MKKYAAPLASDTYYHIFNRGNNSTRIFTKRDNAEYFLVKYIKYISLIPTFAA